MEWLQLGIVLLLVTLWYPLYGRKVYGRWQAFKAWEASQEAVDDQRLLSADEPTVLPPALLGNISRSPLDTTVFAGAGMALANPPHDLRVDLHEMLTKNGTDPYSFPVGWCREGEKPALVHAALVNDVNHILLTGLTDCGKDGWARNMLLSLCLLNLPEKVQVAIIDGKGGLSWIGWETKQHVWLMAESTDDIPTAMQALKAERERRQTVLKQARCEKWDEYTGSDLPLLVVFVSELMLLQDATSKGDLADWLNTELTSARAAGLRYIVSSQTVTRMDTRWRSQIGLFIAGYQSREDADEPNTGLSTKDIVRYGTTVHGLSLAVPPSALPTPPDGQGVFTCIQGRTVFTIRGTYINRQHKEWLLSHLPEKSLQTVVPQIAIAVPASSDTDVLLDLLKHSDWVIGRPSVVSSALSASEADLNAVNVPISTLNTPANVSVKPASFMSQVPLLISADEVPAEEQQRILVVAQQLTSRSKVCQELYGNRGGSKYTWVAKVCDAAGLLMPQQPQERAA